MGEVNWHDSSINPSKAEEGIAWLDGWEKTAKDYKVEWTLVVSGGRFGIPFTGHLETQTRTRSKSGRWLSKYVTLRLNDSQIRDLIEVCDMLKKKEEE